ncbi:MAG: hypothetical protein ACPL3C_03360 [Pyrobaculum sp.]|uniref:hypothetical protein n=1 Tax=Pyrobaculum sp. TaxID=2004705 RepID=UPI003CABA1E7
MRAKAPEFGIEKDVEGYENWIYAETDFKDEKELNLLNMEQLICFSNIDTRQERFWFCETNYAEMVCHSLKLLAVKDRARADIYIETEDVCLPSYKHELVISTVL